ncbi:hypothetical protein LZ31DRAFT_234355 [Colletotrichum somersetense]|nr:hypothetical protein LZ31DRAFT_234355 [Colletotrichum somersetense]
MMVISKGLNRSIMPEVHGDISSRIRLTVALGRCPDKDRYTPHQPLKKRVESRRKPPSGGFVRYVQSEYSPCCPDVDLTVLLGNTMITQNSEVQTARWADSKLPPQVSRRSVSFLFLFFPFQVRAIHVRAKQATMLAKGNSNRVSKSWAKSIYAVVKRPGYAVKKNPSSVRIQVISPGGVQGKMVENLKRERVQSRCRAKGTREQRKAKTPAKPGSGV